ncbi:DUF1800 domain-containing protein [Zoogloea sp.]|uniref:DUF1800 domain-containing protein n=1 Tax=Zoogloea sp. TaxID=49181 RepID=UPI001AD308D0|nr:DUF1800 domain-containing protein [Zoogloea sp.]MBN8282114.1 DUF1800 domain-containing protein [Zoogloea sp.]MBN8464102.1 DUF1800 domain-containing protein [Dechloromonas sp.]
MKRTLLDLIFLCILLTVVSPVVAETTITASDLMWLNRVTYGINQQTIEAFSRLGRAGFLNAQLQPSDETRQELNSGAPERPLNDLQKERSQRRQHANTLPPGEEKSRQLIELGLERTQLIRQATELHLTRAVYSPDQLKEQLAWFWFNHFTVHGGKGDIATMVGNYEAALRPHLLGKFKDLLRISLHHPAMLIYLDNTQNRAGKINENYARELLELHTLGIDGGYTQKDVQELARILTGLQANLSGAPPKLPKDREAEYVLDGVFQYNPAHHDYGDKTFMGRSIKGRGLDEVNEILDFLADHPVTARFISRKLIEYFVADTPPARLISAATATFQRTQGDIAEVLRVILDSPEMEASLGKKFKSPFQYSISALRLLHGGAPSPLPPNELRLAEQLGEPLFGRTTPDGYPLVTAQWATPAQLLGRIQSADRLAKRWHGDMQKAPSSTDAPWCIYQPLLSSTTLQAISSQPEPTRAVQMFLSAPAFMYR